jgi:DNA-binding response OmpR family regulator
LAVVQGIVATHGGGIAVESKAGVGSIFRVYFPASARVEAATIAVPPPKPGRGEHVLVVDDEASVGSFTGVSLEQHNYRVIVFDDPRRALAAVRTNPYSFEALITDHTMPGITGIDLIREVRAAGANIPAVVMTGNSGALSAEKLGALERVVLLEKPFSGEDIARSLRALLDRTPP